MKKAVVIFLILNTFSFAQTNKVRTSWPDRVFTDTIVIFPGEVLFFGVKFKGDSIIGFKEKKPVKDSTNTLIISLDEKNTEHLEDVPSMLTVYNPFDKKLFYKVDVIHVKKQEDGFVRERVLPVPPKKPFWGIWANQVKVVRLYDLNLK